MLLCGVAPLRSTSPQNTQNATLRSGSATKHETQKDYFNFIGGAVGWAT